MALKYGGKTISDYSAMRGPCPSGFHIPLRSEWVALSGVLVNTLGLASDGSSIKTYLKMPFAGSREWSSSNVVTQDTNGYYWSSTAENNNSAYYFAFNSTAIFFKNSNRREYGFPIRAFKDFSVVPDNSWTTLYDGSSIASGAGIFHNPANGLISISGDGTTWITIADKNLGATTVYNDGATLSQANCGNYYQRGNNYGFPKSGSVTTSSTQVDASNYGPGNYYSSNTFITFSGGDWSSVKNDNLRGGVTGVKQNPVDIVERYYGGKLVNDYSAMRGPCHEGFHVPKSSERSAVVNAGVSLGARTTSGTTSVTNFRTYLKLPNIVYLFPGNGLPGTGWTPQHRYYWGCRQMGSDGSGRYCDALDVVEDYGGSIKVDNVSSNHGCPVRPFKDKPVVPDSNWTVLYDGSSVATGAGIFYNATLGLISISSDGTTWITIANKNAGATSVYNFGDTITSANGGGLYQWGNNYPFPIDGATTTSSTRVDTTGYGPGNYYYGSTFITGGANDDWFSPRNRDLWGGVTGIKQHPAKVIEVYYGSTKIWPNLYEISYNLKGGNLSDLQAAGFDELWTNGGYSFTSDGLQQTSSSNDRGIWIIKRGLDLTNAKKLIAYSVGKWQYASWSNGKEIRLATAIPTGGTMTNPRRDTYFTYSNNSGYRNSELPYVNVSGTSTILARGIATSTNGADDTITLTIDFENKTIEWKVTGNNNYTLSANLTDEQYNATRNMTAIYWGWGRGYHSYDSYERLKEVYLKIEY